MYHVTLRMEPVIVVLHASATNLCLIYQLFLRIKSSSQEIFGSELA